MSCHHNKEKCGEKSDQFEAIVILRHWKLMGIHAKKEGNEINDHVKFIRNSHIFADDPYIYVIIIITSQCNNKYHLK